MSLNTTGGGVSYMHSGMYGMYALQESVRQMRGTAPAPAQIPGARISVCLGVGGMFAASGHHHHVERAALSDRRTAPGLARFFVIRARDAHIGHIVRNRPWGADG